MILGCELVILGCELVIQGCELVILGGYYSASKIVETYSTTQAAGYTE